MASHRSSCSQEAAVRSRRRTRTIPAFELARSVAMLILMSALLADGLSATQGSPRGRDRTPIESLLEQTLERLGSRETEVMDALGEPLARTVDQGINRHERGLAIDLVTLHYKGLVVDLVHVPQQDKWMLSRLVMTDRSWSDRINVRVPSTRTDTLEAFGPATRDSGRQSHYQTDRLTQAGPDAFEVVFEGTRAAAWIWSYWID